MERLVTSIKALAQRLDVSIGTVSRALNDRPGVNAETRARVLRAAEEVGYIANASGRSLRRGATNAIGLVIETGNPYALDGDNFFIALADAMQGAMARRGYDLLILPCHRAGDPLDFLRRVVRRGVVDGVVVSATRRRDPRIELLLGSRLPFLSLGRSETAGDAPWVDLDFEGLARTSVERLAALGHRRIAVAVPEGDANLSHVYRQAASRALERHGLPEDLELMVEVPSGEQGGLEAAQRLLLVPDRPTAVMTCCEPMILGLYAALAREGRRPGRDLSVIGFRNNPQLRYLDPPPSCFSLALDALGTTVADTIVDVVEAGRLHKPVSSRLIWPMDFLGTASIRPLLR
jgi:DNA-binding LacI/PurR family transcriptional regulator